MPRINCSASFGGSGEQRRTPRRRRRPRRRVPLLLPTFFVLGLLGAWAGTSMGQVPATKTVTATTTTEPSQPARTGKNGPRQPAPPIDVPRSQSKPPKPAKPRPRVRPSKPRAAEPPSAPAPVPAPAPTPPAPAPAPPTPAPLEDPGASDASAPRAATSSRSSGTVEPDAATDLLTTREPRHRGLGRRLAVVTRVRASRSWLGRRGPVSRRALAISFSLSAPATVIFRVDELAPECRFRGTFRVRGRSGRNVVRFRGRLRGRLLPPGTYRVTAYPRGRPGRRLETVTVVVLARPAGRAALAARARNTCGVSTKQSPGWTGAAEPLSPAGGVAGARARLVSPKPKEGRSRRNRLGGALGTFAADAFAVPPAIFALSGLAVLLLAFASMPQPIRTSRAGATLVHHRGTIALAGVTVLITSLLAFLLL